MAKTPTRFDDLHHCVDWIIESSGGVIRLALPLGLGKANLIANEIYRRAVDDPRLELVITTALSLEIPVAGSDLEQRFQGPFVERVYGDCPQLLYAIDRRANRLPNNIKVAEFFMAPGALLNNEHAQLNYISSNYTHITRDLIDRGVNVIGQLVTTGRVEGREEFSLSCNPDLTLDIMSRQRAAGKSTLMVGEVNRQLPFMYGDAVVEPSFFDGLLENESTQYTLFSTPKTPIGTVDYMIGLHASALVRDGGTVQLGIGSLGDAVVYALGLRQTDNALYRDVLESCEIPRRYAALIDQIGDLSVFDEGLYGATEMLVDGFLELYKTGILKRRVYGDVALQRLINEKRIDPSEITRKTVQQLQQAGAINDRLTKDDIDYLKHWGVLNEATSGGKDKMIFADGTELAPDLADPVFLDQLSRRGLGSALKHGVIAHGGFFLGPQSFYQELNALDESERRLIDMTSVLSVNQLYGNEVLDSLQRKDARFINSCLFATLTGAIVSDGLEDQRVLSGVGGQFNFVSMAHALADGRSIIKVRSTREGKRGLSSNIRMSYAHTTIPRHLRDIVVSEYGIADLRGKTDSEVAASMLNIADSRFQPGLLREATAAGKLPSGYSIPDQHAQNLPEKLDEQLARARQRGEFPEYPFGTDFTETEQVLLKALTGLHDKTRRPVGKLLAVIDAWKNANPTGLDDYLGRMDLENPTDFTQKLAKTLLINELNKII